jgi:hypothetical protein
MLDLDSDVSTVIKAEQGKLVVRRTQDTTGYLEQNKAEMNEAPSWRPYAGTSMRKVATIPNVIVEKWMREGVNIFDPSPETQKKIAEKLNSNEYKKLRTYPGRVGYRT